MKITAYVVMGEDDRTASEPSEEGLPWSSDDGQKVYKEFKDRKSVKRKRAAAINRRAKEAVKSNKKQKTARDNPYDEDDEEFIEEALPEYLKERRQQFDKAKELNDAGLRLPPNYEDTDFSDDERISALDEKPQLPTLKPYRAYKDFLLPYSMGVIPAPTAQWLRDYQIEGTAFLHELFVYQKGGILGDDMGLGKTIQVIACLTAAFGKTGDERDAKRMRKMRRAGKSYPKVIIVCPGSLMENWKSELQRWGYWSVDLYHDKTKDSALQAAKNGRIEIMITTYTTYRINKGAINLVDWDCVIADECHIIKEPKSEITRAMQEINALCRIGLTGTAIQNNYQELWTLLNWTNPGQFGPLKSWQLAISDPLKLGQSHDATMPQLAKARGVAEKLVNNLLPRFFLRRMKSIIAEQLPKKSDRVVFCPLTDIQAEAYENFASSEVVTLIKTATDLCDCNSGKKRGWCCYILYQGTGWQAYVFPCIQTLQKLSNHVALLLPTSSDPQRKQNKELDFLQQALPQEWRDLWRDRDSILNFANQSFCGKWAILKKLLRFWHSNGDKVLVFSHSVRLLRMLHTLFNATEYNVSYLDGSMTYVDRQQTVDDFNADPAQFVFLISTRAGGVGLNITSANKVVIFDPNWNPSYDLQAQDRAYRIGQLRDVEVFRLVSVGTIEEIVYARQIYKQQQANIGYNASTERRYFKGVQDDPTHKGEIFGLRNLFSFQGDNVVLRDIVNKTNVAESKAGVQVVGLDMQRDDDDDNDLFRGPDDDEDGAMSQIAQLIAAGESAAAPRRGVHKIDAVQAILASAGVEYTHENSEVVGSSKIEARLSKRAQEAINDVDMMYEHVFPETQQDDGGGGGGKVYDNDSDDGVRKGGRGIAVASMYKPPEEVRKRQFCSMAALFGFEDVTQFALVVEGWTQAKRRDALDKFYAGLRAKTM